MSKGEKNYTYHGGQKIELEKSPDQMVVRLLPDKLDDAAIVGSEQVSSASARIKTKTQDLESLMTRSRSVAPTHHAYYEVESGSEFLITDRIFVTFKENLSDEEIDKFAGKYGLVKKASYSGRDYLFQLTDHTGMNPVKLVVKLTEDDPLVEISEHDLNRRPKPYQFQVPIDPEYSKQWHLHTNINDPDYDPRSCSMCEDAWLLLGHYGSNEVVIAISDDGCKLDHHDFDSPGKFAGWGYFRGQRLITSGDFDADPAQMYKPGSNHGTSCAGVIGGEVDASQTVGAAPGCRLLPIQWESSGPSLFISDSKLLSILDYIADKVDVMSNSWGGVPINTWATRVVNRISELAQTGGRRGKGIVFLWAAGNENCLINYTADVDVPYSDGVAEENGSYYWEGVDTARRFRNNLVGIPGLMHIAALASTAKRSHYSNYGPGILLCAPTSNMHTYYRMTVRGLRITTTTGNSGGVTHDFGGTSSATPLVAGIAALAISANQNLTALEVVSILKQTASKDLNFTGYSPTPPASYDNNTSWDISPIAPFNNGDFIDEGDPEGNWSPWFGHGRVDAAAAVNEALSRVVRPQGTIFQGSSSPGTSIPDRDDTGIKDTIDCDKNFSISSIKVSVDITHTYIGDLRLTLISPSGTPVILHNRSGGGADNIHKVYDTSLVPQLQNLVGEQAEGTWTLHVQDLASIDTGELQGWALEISGQDEKVVYVEDITGIIIPDDDSGGIERILDVTQDGQLQSMEMELDITHPYIGDLVVELVSPGNTTIFLHNRIGGSADNIIKTYTESNTSSLQTLRGEPINGSWKLKVSDRAAWDQGKLNRWALKLVLIA